RRQERALLAVHEVRQQPAKLLAAQLLHLGRGQVVPQMGAVAGNLHVGQVLSLDVDPELPGQLFAGVPLIALRLLVEVVQLAPHHLVVPRIGGVEGRGEQLDLPLALVVGCGVFDGDCLHETFLLLESQRGLRPRKVSVTMVSSSHSTGTASCSVHQASSCVDMPTSACAAIAGATLPNTPRAIPSRMVCSMSCAKSAWARRTTSWRDAVGPKTNLKTSRLSCAKRQNAREARRLCSTGSSTPARAASTAALRRVTASSTSAS